MENKGAKGHATDILPANSTLTLFNAEGPGIINRMWFTTTNRDNESLRNLQITIYWDGRDTPAVAVPFGNFFCNGLAQVAPLAAFENCFFSNPEGKSFNSFVPMPFRKAARITLTNTADKDIPGVWYEINYTRLPEWNNNMLYFHAISNKEEQTRLGTDYTVLPLIRGTGRFLGISMGIQVNGVYQDSWWGEGELKMYLDGDTDFPTLATTGTEDYVGTAFRLGSYSNWYQGCPVANREQGHWAFYRFHVTDPVYFYKDIRITLQQIGGGNIKLVRELYESKASMIPISVHQDNGNFIKLLEIESAPSLMDKDFPTGWVNYYRQDTVSSVAYFYLDQPVHHGK